MQLLPILSYVQHYKKYHAARFEAASGQYGRNQLEIDILLFLHNNPDCRTASDICRYRGLAKSNVSAAVEQLRARGVVCLAAALYHSRPLDEAPQSYPDGLCAVIGSEGQGLTDAAVQACDMAVRIPMTDLVESLNAGVAGSVLLWHFRGV